MAQPAGQAGLNVPPGGNPPTFTVRDAMLSCGVTQQQADTLADQVFMDSYESCMDLSDDDLKEAFKTLANLTIAEGRIRLLPAVKNRIKAFHQWAKDQFRMGLDPSTTAFPVAQTQHLLNRAKSHQLFIKKAETLSSAAKPEKFSADVLWDDFAPAFKNYLRSLPGRNGVPLVYVVRQHDAPDATPHPDFLDDYVAMATLNGPAFVSDSAEVHTLLVNFVAGHPEAESIIKVFEDSRDGRGACGMMPSF